MTTFYLNGPIKCGEKIVPFFYRRFEFSLLRFFIPVIGTLVFSTRFLRNLSTFSQFSTLPWLISLNNNK